MPPIKDPLGRFPVSADTEMPLFEEEFGVQGPEDQHPIDAAVAEEFGIRSRTAPTRLNSSLAAPGIVDDSASPQAESPSKDAAGESENAESAKAPVYKQEIVWKNIIIYILLHAGALYGLYLLFAQAKWQTWLFTYVMYTIGGLGITAGAHRLWSHKAYKANTPMRIILMLFNCVAMQDDVITWVRDHRVHHKFTETDADPYNARRGFFFSHAGWLMLRKHPKVKEIGSKLDMADIFADPVLRFQRNFYKPLALGLCFVMPTIVPWYFWGESALVAYFTAGILRYVIDLNVTWSVNSVAHMFGSKPYDASIWASQNFTSIIGALGEGFHNYHHVFPWDYRASEYAWRFNITTVFIDFFAAIGWAYDRKIVNREMISKKKLKSGQPPEEIQMKYIYG